MLVDCATGSRDAASRRLDGGSGDFSGGTEDSEAAGLPNQTDLPRSAKLSKTRGGARGNATSSAPEVTNTEASDTKPAAPRINAKRIAKKDVAAPTPSAKLFGLSAGHTEKKPPKVQRWSYLELTPLHPCIVACLGCEVCGGRAFETILRRADQPPRSFHCSLATRQRCHAGATAQCPETARQGGATQGRPGRRGGGVRAAAQQESRQCGL
jgi:hypothetical protein